MASPSQSDSAAARCLHPLVADAYAQAAAAHPPGGAEQRILRVESALYAALEVRGHAVKRHAATIGGYVIGFEMHEPVYLRSVPLTKQDEGFRRRVRQTKEVRIPSGQLVLTATCALARTKRRLKDRLDKPLERQIDEIVRRFEAMAAQAAQSERDAIESEAQWQAELRRAAHRLHKRQEREARPERLRSSADDWIAADHIRAFLDVLEKRLSSAGSPTPAHLTEWLVWARNHVEALDPLSDEGMARLRRHAEAVAYEPIDDEQPSPEEAEWYSMGFLDDYLEDPSD